MSTANEELDGFVATNCGRTNVSVSFHGDGRAHVDVFARWMGDDKPLEVTLRCKHERTGSHSGLLFIEDALDAETGGQLTMPPSEDVLILEYVRVPPQEANRAATGSMAIVGHWTIVFTMVLWLHPDSAFDDGTDLAAEEYDTPPERFHTVARALKWLTRPWKLGGKMAKPTT